MSAADLTPTQREFLKLALLAAWRDARTFKADAVCAWLKILEADCDALLAWGERHGLLARSPSGEAAFTDAGVDLASALRSAEG
ncbi:MAG TPA: hypothetical protein VF796_21635 [Humisphaera sp.]